MLLYLFRLIDTDILELLFDIILYVFFSVPSGEINGVEGGPDLVLIVLVDLEVNVTYLDDFEAVLQIREDLENVKQHCSVFVQLKFVKISLFTLEILSL